jgi:hypothetical protein
VALVDRGWTLDSERIVSEEIDGEVIAIDLVSGAYYSFGGASAVAWQSLTAGASLDDVAAATGGDRDELAAFLAGLVAEGLVDGDVAEIGEGVEPLSPLAPGAAEPAPDRLAIRRYDDMRELLVIDPIHEVDEAGWPHAR